MKKYTILFLIGIVMSGTFQSTTIRTLSASSSVKKKITPKKKRRSQKNVKEKSSSTKKLPKGGKSALIFLFVCVSIFIIYFIISHSKKNNDQQNKVQQIFAFIKPDAFANAEEIKKRIVSEGFKILKSRRITLTTEQAQNFYAEHKGKPFFDELIRYITSGSVCALMLERENAIRVWRDLMGPTDAKKAKEEAPNSIRALWGTDITQNAVHGSDNVVSADRELRFFFELD